MKSICFTLLLALITTLAFAQNRQPVLAGLVRDTSGTVLDIATVQLFNADGATVAVMQSDSTGRYHFPIPQKGNYRVRASYLGYAPNQSAEIAISKDTFYQAPDLVLHTAAGNSLQGVTITATKPLFELKPDKLVMNVADNPVTAGNSIFQLLRQAPGMSVDKDDNLQLNGASVQIYIDDRPAFLTGAQLTEYLKNLPADIVATMEIITQPSSKYGAAGTAGIINIRLKKNKVYGLNGIANLGGGVGRYGKANSGLNMNYRKGKINLFGNGYAGYGESYNQLNYNSVIRGAQTIYQDRDNYWHPKTKWVSYSAGVDYYINDKNVLGLLVNGEETKETAMTRNNTVFSNTAKQAYQYINSTKDDKNNTGNVAANINYKSTLDTAGSELSLNADYGNYTRNATDLNENIFRGGDQQESRLPYIFRNNQPARINLASGKADYTQYLPGKTKIELGARYSYVKSDSRITADSLRNGSWADDAGRSNHFIYTEQIVAGYATWVKEFKSTSIQLGLRAEHTQGTGEALTLGQVNKRSYLSFFPTAYFSQRINADNTLNLSYGRRINRPDYQSLNPFVLFIDPYTIFEGNPNLQPSFSHNIELKHAYKQTLFSSLSYRFSDNQAVSVIQQDAATGRVKNISRNGERGHYLIVNLFVQLQPLSWWSTDNGLNTIISQVRSQIPGFSYDTKAVAAFLNSNHSFNLPHKIKLQTNIYYAIPRREGLAKLQCEYGWSIGIQRQFAQERMLVKFNANNIIGSNAYRAHYLGEGLDIRWRNEWEGRRFMLSFSYKFGSRQIKAARDRDMSSEEKDRIKL